MNKNLLKHILSMFLLGFLLFSLWLFCIYGFLCNYIKKEEFPAVEKSKVLSEVSKGHIYIPKIKPSVRELEGNKYICQVDILIEDNRLLSKEKTSFLNTLFKFSYPAINKNEEILAYIEICPSFAILDKFLSDKFVLSVVFCSIIVFLLLICLIFYLYIKRYLFSPFYQIKTIVENLSKNKRIEVNRLKSPGVWKELFTNLSRLNNNIFDINTVMRLLFSATDIKGSELELINSVQQIFDIIKSRIPLSKCILLIPENNQLKVVTKRGFFKKDIAFITKDTPNYVWDCYEGALDKIINDISEVNKDKLSILCEGMESGSFAAFALTDKSVSSCVGVFVIVTELKNSFTYDLIKTIKVISEYFVSLINKTLYYQKIEEKSVRLEAESQYAIKELISKNDLLTKRMKNVNAVFDIFSFAMLRAGTGKGFETKEIIEYIIEKSKKTFNVKYSGIFVYNEGRNELEVVLPSFDLKKNLSFIDKKDSVFSKILKTKQSLILNTVNDLKKYTKTDFSDYININSAVFLPVKDKDDNIIAFFSLINKNDGEFSEVDIKFLEYIATIIAVVIKNKK